MESISSFDLCKTLLPDSSPESYAQLRSLRIGLDKGTINPQTILESKCFPAFIDLQNRPPPHQGYTDGIIASHFPQFLLPSNTVPIQPAPDYSHYSAYGTYSAYEDDDEAKYLGRQTIGLAQHVAGPTVSKVVGENLLPELISLIGGYHTNCDTLTEGGVRCGLGDRGDFVFHHTSPLGTETDEYCQSECTDHLCTAWLNNLLSNLPTEVLVTTDVTKGGRRVPVRITDISLHILDTFWNIDLPNASFTKSRESSSSSSSSSSLSSLSSFAESNKYKLTPEFLAAGCRILNSGQVLKLIMTIKLEESTVKRVGLLKNLYHDKNQISFPGLPKGNYFRNTDGWRLIYPNTLISTITITDRKTQNELFAKRREQQKLQLQRQAQAVALERRKRSFQAMSSSSSYLPTLSTLSAYSVPPTSLLLPHFPQQQSSITTGAADITEEGGGREPTHKTRRIDASGAGGEELAEGD